MNYNNKILNYIKSNKELSTSQIICVSLISYMSFKLITNILSFVKGNIMHNKMISSIARYKEIRNKKIQNFLLNESLEISEETKNEILLISNIEQLKKRYLNREFTVRQVIIAYLKQCFTVGEEHNLIADINPELVIKEANEKDLLLNNYITNKQELPELFGVPISIKENHLIKDYIATFGYCSLVNKPLSKINSYVVENLKKLGAIPIVKSNIPVSYMYYDSINNIYGRAKNPWNKKFTAGGSSGGECGLVASYSSLVGMGSDTGGSIRNPSNNCGVYGLKPSSGRFSKKDCLNSDGTTYLTHLSKSSLGPIARNPDDLISICKSLFGSFEQDYLVYNKKFDNDMFNLVGEYDLNKTKKKIKIGYFLESKEIEVASSIKSHLSKLLVKLKQSFSDRYDLIEYDLDKFILNNEDQSNDNNKGIISYFMTQLINSGYLEDSKTLSEGEKLPYFLTDTMLLRSLNPILKKIYLRYLKFTGEKRHYNIIDNTKTYYLYSDYVKIEKQINILRERIKMTFDKDNIDALILPNGPFPALKFECIKASHMNIYYQQLFNVCDMPAASIPIGFVDDTSYYSKLNDMYNKLIKKSMNDSLGLPIGIQVAAMPYKEELLLRIIKDIDSITKFSVDKSFKIFDILKGNKVHLN